MPLLCRTGTSFFSWAKKGSKKPKSKQMRLPALPSFKKCYQGSVGYRQQTTSALDALLKRSHSHTSARCFDGLPAGFSL
jgi:hypothetical protein